MQSLCLLCWASLCSARGITFRKNITSSGSSGLPRSVRATGTDSFEKRVPDFYHTSAELAEAARGLLQGNVPGASFDFFVSAHPVVEEPKGADAEPKDATSGVPELVVVRYARVSPPRSVDEAGRSLTTTCAANTTCSTSIAPLRVFFLFGEHARELISSESGLHFLRNLRNGTDIEVTVVLNAIPRARPVGRGGGAWKGPPPRAQQKNQNKGAYNIPWRGEHGPRAGNGAVESWCGEWSGYHEGGPAPGLCKDNTGCSNSAWAGQEMRRGRART